MTSRIFSCAAWPFTCFVLRNLYFGHLPIFYIYIYIAKWALYKVLETNLLLVSSFSNISSHSVGFLSVLFTVSFAVEKVLSLIRFYLLIFLISFTLREGSKKKYLAMIYGKECSMFSSKSFIVYSLTFRLLTHFEFIYVYQSSQS